MIGVRPKSFTSLLAGVLLLGTGLSLPLSYAGDSGKADWKAAKPNTWVKVLSEKTGGRSSPIFFYAPKLKLWIESGGRPGGTYANAKSRHYDTEHFDLTKLKWENAYPEGTTYKNVSGPTDAPAPKGRGILGKVPDGRIRIRCFGSAYGTCSRAHHQFAFDPDANILYAYLFSKTLTYDVAKREWANTGAKPFHQGRWPLVWGSLCYDPVNKQILSVGGACGRPGGTPGTHVYKVADKTWEKLALGSESLNKLRGQVEEVRRRAWALISACRNRLHVTETEEETKAKLAPKAEALSKLISDAETAIKAGELKDAEALGARVALERLAKAQAIVKESGAKLDDGIDAEKIGTLRGAFNQIWLTERALDAEPHGRAHAQMVYAPEHQKIVLFGGSLHDRCMADTWVYDCKTRKWEQRFPALNPSPRAAHAMAWLPRSKQVVLAGGYTMGGWWRGIPHELWTYDVGKNEWKLLIALPAVKRKQPANAPAGTPGGESWSGAGSTWVAAANEEDVLVSISTGGGGRSTWVCKVDPSQGDDALTREKGVPPDAMAFATPPIAWDKAAKPDKEKVATFLKGLKRNIWTVMPKAPKSAPWRAWNTTAYDTDRQQWLWFGGGHVTYMGTDVSHYSMREAQWSQSYNTDLPTAPTGGYYVKASLTFHDRPQVPVHMYQAYAYDPPSGLMLYSNRAYNVAEREWEKERTKGSYSSGVMKTLLETTPEGVVAISKSGLFKYDAASRSWKALPYKGPKLPQPWCDGGAICYDPNHKCLWLAPNKGTLLVKYDIEKGTGEKIDIKVPKALGKFPLWREQVVIPDANLILLMRRFKGPGGKLKNVAFDTKTHKYYWVDLPFSDKKQHNFSWSEAMVYDAKLGLVLLHASKRNPGSVWALKFDREAAQLEEIKDAPTAAK